MASQVLFLALVLFAIVGLASAAATDPVATSPSGSDDSAGDIGTMDGDSNAAPVGGPVPDGVFTPITTTDAPSPSPTAGAAALEVSAIAGITAAVAAFFL